MDEKLHVEPRIAAETAIARQAEQPLAILITEDEFLIRFMLAEHFRDYGYRVLEAGKAAEAVEILSSNVAVDVLCTDVQMPGEMDGFGLARWTGENRPGVHIIVTSGFGRDTHKPGELRDDYTYLSKPFDPACLEQEVKRLLAG